MSSSSERDARQWVVGRVLTAIKQAHRRGQRLSVKAEVERLAKEPACPMAPDAIREEILRLAVSERTSMDLD